MGAVQGSFHASRHGGFRASAHKSRGGPAAPESDGWRALVAGYIESGNPSDPAHETTSVLVVISGLHFDELDGGSLSLFTDEGDFLDRAHAVSERTDPFVDVGFADLCFKKYLPVFPHNRTVLSLSIDGDFDRAFDVSRVIVKKSDGAVFFDTVLPVPGCTRDLSGFAWLTQLEKTTLHPDFFAMLLDPVSGPAAGGTSVEITGNHFDADTPVTVTFGGNAATNVVVHSATRITCDTPAGTAGAVDVTVTGNSFLGPGTEAGAYTYTE